MASDIHRYIYDLAFFLHKNGKKMSMKGYAAHSAYNAVCIALSFTDEAGKYAWHNGTLEES